MKKAAKKSRRIEDFEIKELKVIVRSLLLLSFVVDHESESLLCDYLANEFNLELILKNKQEEMSQECQKP